MLRVRECTYICLCYLLIYESPGIVTKDTANPAVTRLYLHCLFFLIPSIYSTCSLAGPLCLLFSLSPDIQIAPSLASVSYLVKCHLFIGAFNDYLIKNINKLTINLSFYLLYFISCYILHTRKTSV